VREDGTYAYLYINQYDFTGFGGITITNDRVCPGSIEGCKIADNPGKKGLYLYALLQQDDDYGYIDDDDSQGAYRDRIRNYWLMLGKPIANCDAPDVDVPWFPWEEAGFTRQEALRTIAAECYGAGGCGAADRPEVTEKLAVFGVSQAEIDSARAALEAERDAADATHMAGSLRAEKYRFDELDSLGVSNG
jgi:hypothetical protein